MKKSPLSKEISRVSTTCDRGFPQVFDLYFRKDLNYVLATSAKDPFPYFFVDTSLFDCYLTSLTLHRGSDNTETPIASLRVDRSNHHGQITLGPLRFGASPTEHLSRHRDRKNYFKVFWSFSVYLPVLGERENFIWKRSSGTEIRGLGYLEGLKLIRGSTGQLVAVFANLLTSKNKRGQMQFWQEDLGNQLWLMTVMSLFSILEGSSGSY